MEEKRKHEFLRWNPKIQQWFCVKCGRTSDHEALADAKTDIEQYECEMPSIEMSDGISQSE